MLIKIDSKLALLTRTKHDDDRIIFLEAIIFIINTIDDNYKQLIEDLYIEKHNANENIIRLWTIVDNIYRLYRVLENSKGFKKSEVWFQLTLRALILAEPLRHYFEHYENKLREINIKVLPLLGHIGYISTKHSPVLVTATVIPGVIRLFKGLPMVNPAGKQIRDKIDHVTYYLGKDMADISDIYYRIVSFSQELESYIISNWS